MPTKLVALAAALIGLYALIGADRGISDGSGGGFEYMFVVLLLYLLAGAAFIAAITIAGIRGHYAARRRAGVGS